MGQYYYGIIFKENTTDFTDISNVKGAFNAHDWGDGLRLCDHSWLHNGMVMRVMERIREMGTARVVWAGDYADKEPDKDFHLYNMIVRIGVYSYGKAPERQCQYIINHDKHEYIDLMQCPENSFGWCLHPLPLMTCEGNGRGGGDFDYDDKKNGTHYDDYVGKWSRDRLSVSNEKPDDTYTEIRPDFILEF